MTYQTATALSPLDGRYATKLDPLRRIFSEYGLIARRLEVEVQWLKTLSSLQEIVEVPRFSAQSEANLLAVLEHFDIDGASQVVMNKDRSDVTSDLGFLKEQWIGDGGRDLIQPI